MFIDGALEDFLAQRLKAVRADVEQATEDYILNVSVEQYVQYLVSRYSVEPVTVDFDGVSAEQTEEPVPAEEFPHGFWVEHGERYKKPIFIYFLPLSGDASVLHYYPNPRLHWTHEVSFQPGHLCVRFVCFHDTTDHVRREYDDFIRNFRQQLSYVDRQLRAFNDSLASSISETIQQRRERLLSRRRLAESLGVPLRARTDAPKTFAVPTTPRKPKIEPRPVVTEKGYAPEPTLDEEAYRDILRAIYEFGKNLERLPSTYAGKDEEALRDYLLMHLEPNFEGSTTGETFNRTGKTDILLRYQGSNVFVAECKVWRGEREFSRAIDQLLHYLTWRDSKAGLVLFVNRKDFSAVIETAQSATQSHPSFLRTGTSGGESWLNFSVHLPGDRNREVRLALLLFHLP